MSSKSTTTTLTVTKKQAALLQAILATTDTEAPATTRKTKAKKARKTVNRKAASTTIEGKTCLTSKNRKQFLADHGLPAGKSVRDLCLAVAAGEITLTGNWIIGPRNAERFGVTTKAVKAKKAKKTKATKAEVVKVKAQVFRRANGTIAPKGEWAIREVLEAQGGLTRAQVDEKTAAVLAVL